MKNEIEGLRDRESFRWTVRTAIFVTLVTLIAPFSSSASAGTKDGGGGFFTVGPKGSPCEKPQLLDLVEFLDRYPEYKFASVEAIGDPKTDEQLMREEFQTILNQKFLKEPENSTLREILVHDVRVVAQMVDEQLENANPQSYLFSQEDIGLVRPVRLPVGCQPRLGAFLGGDAFREFYLDTGLWATLSITSRVGLIFHEAIYAMRRSLFNDSGSSVARRITGLLLTLPHFEAGGRDQSLLSEYKKWYQVDFNQLHQLILPVYKELGFFDLAAKLVKGSSAEVQFSQGGKVIVKTKVSKAKPSAESFTQADKNPFGFNRQSKQPDLFNDGPLKLNVKGKASCEVQVTLTHRYNKSFDREGTALAGAPDSVFWQKTFPCGTPDGFIFIPVQIPFSNVLVSRSLLLL